MNKPVSVFIFLIIAIMLSTSDTHAGTYYIDFEGGNDSNAGTSTAAAWKTIPGTRNTANDGWQSSDWGSGTFNSRSKVPAGTTFKLKSGSTHDSSNGGRIQIDSTYYRDGTSVSPITIERDTSWGMGAVAFDGTGMTFGTWDAFIHILTTDFVQINGHTTNGIVIKHAARRGVQNTGTSEASMSPGFRIQYALIQNTVAFGIHLQRSSDAWIDNVEVDGNDQDGWEATGILIGDDTFGCDDIVITNTVTHDWGNTPGTQQGGSSARIGIVILNSHNVTMDNVTTYDNEGDGIDVGGAGSPASRVSNNVTVRNSESYNNAGAIGCSSEDIEGDSIYYIYNNVLRDSSFGVECYNGATAHIYNNTLARNGRCFYLYTEGVMANRDTVLYVKNNICYQSRNSTLDILWMDDMILSADYNLYIKSGGSYVVRWDYGNPGGENYTYTGENDFDVYQSKRSQDANSHDSYDDGWAASFTDERGNDFTLQAGSKAIDAGVDLSAYFTKDKDGHIRSGTWDLGAYEYQIENKRK